MSRYGPPNDIPQRWDRDRFERFGGRGPPPGRFEEDYRYAERDTPYKRDVAVADRIDERGPWGRYEERDRYFEEDRFAPRRPRRRTDRELFGEVDPRELAGMALTPYRAREDLDLERRSPSQAPPRPGLLRRQSSLDTFDRRPARYERSDYRIPPYTPVPLPIRRERGERDEDDYEQIRYRDYEPDSYREVEIQRERSLHRRKPKSSAPSSVAPSKATSRRSRAKSATTRRSPTPSSSSSSSSSSSFEEVEKVEENQIIAVPDTARKFKKGKTRMPKRLVRREAIMDLGYPFEEEEDFYVLQYALEKEQIDEVIKISESYKESMGPSSNKKVYRFEEKVEEASSAPPPPPPPAEEPAPVEHEEFTRTEWVNPPTIVFGGAKSEASRSRRARSPSAQSSISQVRSRRSPPETVFEERKTVIEERRSPPPPPPVAVPMPPPPPRTEYYERDSRTILEERAPAASSHHSGALVLQREEYRSDRDIQAEIRALEAERRALRLEREAEEKHNMAVRLRERPEEEYQMVEYREERRPREYDRVEYIERPRSKSRNVVRVEKDHRAREKSRAKKVALAVATLT